MCRPIKRLPRIRRFTGTKEDIASWYHKRFSVSLDPEKEVAPLIGSKEGIAHVALCLLNPGDIALITDPGYPVYTIGTKLAGGTPYYLPIRRKTTFYRTWITSRPRYWRKPGFYG